MEAASSPVGVAAASPSLPAQRPQAPRWVSPPGDLSIRLPANPAPAWSRPAQGTAVVFLVLALGLLGWHAWTSHRDSCRPATLEPGALTTSSLDLNEADHAQLLQLPGVGDHLASRIEAYRTEHHGFRDVEELRRIPGIGPKMLEKLRPFVHVEAAASDEEGEPPAAPDRPLTGSRTSEMKAPDARIDINHASAAELRRLPGIGATLSQRILEARARQPFRSVEDLRRVRGIGPKTLERLRPHVVIVER